MISIHGERSKGVLLFVAFFRFLSRKRGEERARFRYDGGIERKGDTGCEGKDNRDPTEQRTGYRNKQRTEPRTRERKKHRTKKGTEHRTGYRTKHPTGQRKKHGTEYSK